LDRDAARWSYTPDVPTKHRRIAVIEDPEISKALALASNRYPGRSSAGLLRQLVILGAGTLEAPQAAPTKLERLVARPGVIPGRGDIQEYLSTRPDLRVFDPDDPNPGTRALEELGEDKI
jgi:hypothetical protein